MMSPYRFFAANMPPAAASLPFAAMAGVLFAVLCLGFAMRSARRKRLVDNLPTSKTTSVFMGLVELKGTAEAEQPLCSFLAEIPCVFHQWQVEEHWSRTVTETYKDSQGKTQTRTRRESGWTTVAQGGDMTPFYLRDDYGIIQVRPERADIKAQSVFSQTCRRGDPLYYAKGPDTSVSNSDHERRFSEQAIPMHAPLYVMGQARERDDLVAAEIAYSDLAPVFLITTDSEDAISSGHAWAHWSLGFLGAALTLGGTFLQMRMNETPDFEIWPMLVKAGAVYAGVWLVCWIWMAFNSMVELRHRVRQAWANIDVQLKRRSDLIPRLVEIVKGLRDYERNVQTEITQLRTELAATAPGEAGPDPSACGDAVKAIAERYPELKASASFLALTTELSATEDRIALSRAYFNDISTFYNTRLETIPDRFIAMLGAMRPQPLMAVDGFVRSPVVVSLAE